MTTSPVRLAVVVASTREGRFGDTVAGWVAREAGHRDDLELDVVDLAETGLPAVASSSHPKSGRYPEAVAGFARHIAAADAFLFVTPEYNHGYPAPLKVALDAIYAEWAAKPASFVSYGGGSGGVRAVEQLRQVLVELHVVPLRDAVALPMARALFDSDGELLDADGAGVALKTALDRLVWWGEALRTARSDSPYEL